MPKYKQLSIDGVIGDLWDDEAIHEAELENVVLNILDSAAVRTKLLNIYHPIGSYYFTNSNTNPGTFLGGTWSQVKGKFLLGASDTYEAGTEGGSADAIVPVHTHSASGDIANSGSHTHTVSGTAANGGTHYHTLPDPSYYMLTYKGTRTSDKVKNMSGSDRIITGLTPGSGADWYGRSRVADSGLHSHTITGSAASSGVHSHTITITVNNSGESGVGMNLPPYKVVYIWVRTA